MTTSSLNGGVSVLVVGRCVIHRVLNWYMTVENTRL